MSADDVVQEAIEELYSIDPDDFMDRRTALATAARKTDRAVAIEIAALRKPTRSAYVLNRLVRSDPEAAQRLADLGGGLLAAQEALDGPKMRELSTQRRGLVEELADQAFELTGQRTPPPALRDEVVSTMNAAVADESVVEQLRTGTLLRSARWDGFGFASPPELSVVRPTAARRAGRGDVDGRRPRDVPVTQPKPKAGARQGSAGADRGTATKVNHTRTAVSSADKRAEEAATRAEAKAEARSEEQRRRQLLAEAQRTARDADSALTKITKAEDEQQTRVRLLHEQLTDARRRLDELRIDVRRAENRQRKAQNALERQQK